MGRRRTLYKLVGRYIDGNETAYYSLVSEDGKSINCNKDQMAFLVGREQVINVNAQIYKDSLLFKGVNVDIRSLPTIQLNKDSRVTEHIQSQNKVKAVSHKAVNITKVMDILNNPSNFKYRRLPEFSPLEIKQLDNVKFSIHQSFTGTNDGGKEYKYILEEKDGLVYLRQEQFQDTYICKSDDMKIFMKALLGLFGYVNVENLFKIKDEDALNIDEKDAFNAYTGASNYYNDILRGLKSPHVDSLSMGIAAFQTVTMLRAYSRLSERQKVDSVLFRGGVEPTVGKVDKGFLSFSYSAGVARNFCSGNQAVLMCLVDDVSPFVNVENIAACLENGEPSEREILRRPYTICKAVKQLGYLDGHKFFVVKYKENYNYDIVIKDFLKTIKPYASKVNDMYLFYRLFNRDINTEYYGDVYGKIDIINGDKKVALNHSTYGYYIANYEGKTVECNSRAQCDSVLKYLLGGD